MQNPTRYPVHKVWPQLMEKMGLSVARVLQRAGVPGDFLQHDTRGITAAQFYGIWQAVGEEAPTASLPMDMAIAVAKGPFIPAVFAFSCSPNVLSGLGRLALFKPLAAPIKLIVTETETRVKLEIEVSEPGLHMPDCMVAFELVYFVELFRNFTATDIVPLEVGTPVFMTDQSEYDRFFGRKATLAKRPSVTLSRQDACRPLISDNPQMLAGFERELTRQLAERRRNTPMSERVRAALLDMLPAGHATVDATCDRLVTSRRSLQRHLHQEGVTFQSILDATRSDLSLHYLRDAEMSVEEISYLLAYRDPNSFYRAFQNWTGRTPAQMRLELS